MLSTRSKSALRTALIVLISMPHLLRAQTIPVYEINPAPKLDALDTDWADIPFTVVNLHKTVADGIVDTPALSVKAATSGGRVFMYLKWPDSEADLIHKPWVWSRIENRYIQGPQREDRLAVHFSLDNRFTTDWYSGAEFTADTWHWKASRSNPAGLAHDKRLVISRNQLLRAYKMTLPSGDAVYIQRPSDSGDELYTTKRYRSFQQPLMPKYLVSTNASGSIADVKAAGSWSDNTWYLEMSRLLDTGHDDDIVLPSTPGQVLAGFAIFDHSENHDHAISDTLRFDFLHRPWPQQSH